MSEVLRLEYDATTESLLVQVDAMRGGVVILGVPQPIVVLSLKDLVTDESVFRDLLKKIEIIAREKFEKISRDPNTIAEAARTLASEQYKLENQKAHFQKIMAETISSASEREKVIQAKEAELTIKEMEIVQRIAELPVPSPEVVDPIANTEPAPTLNASEETIEHTETLGPVIVEEIAHSDDGIDWAVSKKEE